MASINPVNSYQVVEKPPLTSLSSIPPSNSTDTNYFSFSRYETSSSSSFFSNSSSSDLSRSSTISVANVTLQLPRKSSQPQESLGSGSNRCVSVEYPYPGSDNHSQSSLSCNITDPNLPVRLERVQMKVSSSTFSGPPVASATPISAANATSIPAANATSQLSSVSTSLHPITAKFVEYIGAHPGLFKFFVESNNPKVVASTCKALRSRASDLVKAKGASVTKGEIRLTEEDREKEKQSRQKALREAKEVLCRAQELILSAAELSDSAALLHQAQELVRRAEALNSQITSQIEILNSPIEKLKSNFKDLFSNSVDLFSNIKELDKQIKTLVLQISSAREVEELARQDVAKMAFEYFKERREEALRIKLISQGKCLVVPKAALDKIIGNVGSTSSSQNQINIETEESLAKDYFNPQSWEENLAQRSYFPVRKEFFVRNRLLCSEARFIVAREIPKRLPIQLIRDYKIFQKQQKEYQELLTVTKAKVKEELVARKTIKITEPVKTKKDKKEFNIWTRFWNKYDKLVTARKEAFLEKRKLERMINQYLKDLKLANQDFVEEDRLNFNHLIVENRLKRACVRVVDGAVVTPIYLSIIDNFLSMEIRGCTKSILPDNENWKSRTRSLILEFLWSAQSVQCNYKKYPKRDLSLDMRLTPLYRKYRALIQSSMPKFESRDIPPTAKARVKIYWEDQGLDGEVKSKLKREGDKLIIVCTLSAYDYEDRELHEKGIRKNFENYHDNLEFIFKKKKS